MLRYKRSARVRELLREEISLYVQTIQDPGFGFVTITEVKLSDDLRHAKLLYSVLGDDEQKKNTYLILSSHIHRLKKYLGKKLSLRRIPEIKLVLDETSEKASKIFNILDQLHAEKESAEPSEKTDDEFHI
ncbi:MAG: 30S ribosome-binding factor RbfA [bacterium]